MDLINNAKTWIIVGAVIILVIEVRLFRREKMFLLLMIISFSVSGITLCIGLMLSKEEKSHVLFFVTELFKRTFFLFPRLGFRLKNE